MIFSRTIGNELKQLSEKMCSVSIYCGGGVTHRELRAVLVTAMSEAHGPPTPPADLRSRPGDEELSTSGWC